MLTEVTRRESHEKTDKRTRQMMILGAWEGDMTAREIAGKLGFADMNAVRPRITELVQDGYLTEAGVVYDPITGRRVTCWRLSKRGEAL
ncbi:MAG: hypothetical protein ACOX8Q_01875 [Christensenellales bacterium]|jgi:predicted ArsR family transcriptional regulator